MLEVTVNGVALSSRGSLQREIDDMTRVLAALPSDVQRRLVSIFCDSKACADYTIDVKPGHWVEGLDRLLDDTFYHLLGGHNGLTITELSPPCDAPLPPLRFATMGSGFYASPRWLKLRHAMLSHHGARCQCCGVAFPEATVQVDHILPRRDYPELALDPANLQILCRACTLGKGAHDTTDWRPTAVCVAARWLGDDEEAARHGKALPGAG